MAAVVRPQQWIGEDGSELRCGPGEPLAIIEILCRPCKVAGRSARRRLAMVAVSTKPGADMSNLWVRGFVVRSGLSVPASIGGVPVTVHRVWGYPAWRGEGESRRLLLTCGIRDGRGECRHAPAPSRTELLGELVLTGATPGSRVTRAIWL